MPAVILAVLYIAGPCREVNSYFFSISQFIGRKMENILLSHIASCERAKKQYEEHGTPINIEVWKDDPTQYTGTNTNIVHYYVVLS